MKPNEGYEIGQEHLIAQLGLLILEGRTPPENVKTNIKDCLSGDSDSFHHRKEDFISLWKSCDSIFIEVWLYRDENFEEKEAMHGHGGYLLIEQWQIEIKLNRSSEHGFHCTEKMLIQAIKSKLYFSQLSAWLSLTKGKSPRHTYFRLCQMENKTPLKRFIRPPEFHQFPQVSISSTTELFLSLYSFPHSDILLEHPMFSWVLDALPSETPERKPVEKLKPNFDPGVESKNVDSKVLEYPEKSPSNVVRKLEFEDFRVTRRDASEKNTCMRKEFDSTSDNFNTSRKMKDAGPSTSSSEFNENQHFTANKERNDPCEISLSKNLAGSPSSPWKEIQKSEGGQKVSVSKEFREPRLLTSPVKSLGSNRVKEDQSSSFPSGVRELKDVSVESSCRTATVERSSKQKKFNTRQREIMQDLRTVNKITSRQKTSDNSPVESKGCQEYKEISRKSLLARDLCAEGEHSSEKCSPNRTPGVLKCKVKISVEDMRSTRDEGGLVDRQKSKPASLERENVGEQMKKCWKVEKYAVALHRTGKEMENILPQVRRVMDEEYEKELKERLRKCCLTNEKSCERNENEQGICKRKIGKTEKANESKDSVFIAQECRTTIQRNSNISRYHFRHASTGTLPVFHPSTGLPMSSSPAPYRKTPHKQTVDDTCSLSREATSLSNGCGNLSKSAPTLITQSLLVNFEESVLNDRLLPDGVVEGFTAELSASGSKKYLAHVTLPVQAYFFKLSDDNAPSPYMGYISLDVPELSKKGYHVPKKGTIQLTLFNPNQTVVKVFVVLYDFSDMQPNFQTFLRQKTTSLVKTDGLVDRLHDNLHYLIHLRFASSKSGRVYLHTDIRVIFARHPPDQVHIQTTTSGPTNPKYVPRQDV